MGPLDSCPGFKCQTGTGHCLPMKMRCNGVVNCLGAEDEMNCQPGGIFRQLDSDSPFDNPQQIFPDKNPQQASANNKSSKLIFSIHSLKKKTEKY